MKKIISFILVLGLLVGVTGVVLAQEGELEVVVTEVLQPISLFTSAIDFGKIYEPGTYTASTEFTVEGTPGARYILEIEGVENRTTVTLNNELGDTIEVELDFPKNLKLDGGGYHNFLVEAELNLTELPSGGVYSKQGVTATVRYDH